MMSSPDLLDDDDADVPSSSAAPTPAAAAPILSLQQPMVPAPDENNQLTSTTSPVAADINNSTTGTPEISTTVALDLTTDSTATTTPSDLLDTTPATAAPSVTSPEPLVPLNNTGDHSSSVALSINVADNNNTNTDNASGEISSPPTGSNDKSVGETSNSSQTSVDSSGIPLNNIKDSSSSSPLAATTLAASSSSSASSPPKMNTTPNSDDGMSSSQQQPEQYESDFSVTSEANNKNNNPRHSSRRLWIYVAGAIAVVVLIAAIAGGTVASKSKSASTEGDTPSVNIPIPEHEKSQTYLFIESLLPDGGQSLWDPNSYQSRALAFVESTNEVTYTLERTTQRFVLASIYHASNAVKTTYTDFALGADSPVFPWLNSEGWLELPDECQWFGIECNEQGQVESIDLHENLFTGSFPVETALLKNSLKILDIEENIIYNAGDEGLGWLGELTNLQELNIAKTSFQYDGIPSVIGNLVNLVELDVSYCLFFGPLRPEVFTNLQKLQFLYVGGNSYNSAIPETVGQLSSLLYLYAEFADIQGDLSFLQVPNALPGVFEMWVDKNPKLTGNLPSEMGNLVTLASLSFTECDFYGPIPDTMGNLVNMKQLWLYGNRLNGTIPATLGNLVELDRLELEANELSGEMPTEVCNIVYPRGQLEVLEADCQEGGPVTCDSTSCCTCCGPECAGQDPQTLREDGNTSNSAGNSSGTRNNENNGRKQRRLEFVREQRRRLVSA